MSKEAVHSLRAADFLYDEILKSRLDYGCFEVSLRALGADYHLVELLDKDFNDHSGLLAVILRKGLVPSWIVSLALGSTGADIEDLLEGRYTIPKPRPSGVMTGFLGLESYPDELERPNHAIAILPRQRMPRDLRRSLKKRHAYAVVNTMAGGTLMVSADSIAGYAQRIRQDGGQLFISQIWKPQRR